MKHGVVDGMRRARRGNRPSASSVPRGGGCGAFFRGTFAGGMEAHSGELDASDANLASMLIDVCTRYTKLFFLNHQQTFN